MLMTEREIKEAYDRMPNKNKGIEILADRNGCKPRHIRHVLGVPSPKHYLSRANESGEYPSGWGKNSKLFWKFYNSGDKKARLEFDSEKDALRVATSVYKCMNYKHIYDVTVKRRRNVLCLERTNVNARRNNTGN